MKEEETFHKEGRLSQQQQIKRNTTFVIKKDCLILCILNCLL